MEAKQDTMENLAPASIPIDHASACLADAAAVEDAGVEVDEGSDDGSTGIDAETNNDEIQDADLYG